MTGGDAVLEIVDHENGLRRTVHEERGVRTSNLDSHMRPGARFEIDVRLIDARCFLAKPEGVVLRVRNVLR